tara:strand:- start:528 stop:1040 length:513 start_codon:yes stop_codon:yes gene_type:complete
MTSQIPTWLSKALKGTQLATVRNARDGFSIGDLCVVVPNEAHAAKGWQRNRICLIVGLEEFTARIVLTNNCTEYACDLDVCVKQPDTGLTFDLLIACDLATTVSRKQIIKTVGRLDDALLKPVIAAVSRDFKGIPEERRGNPIRGPSDSRWGFRETELDDLYALAQGGDA